MNSHQQTLFDAYADALDALPADHSERIAAAEAECERHANPHTPEIGLMRMRYRTARDWPRPLGVMQRLRLWRWRVWG